MTDDVAPTVAGPERTAATVALSVGAAGFLVVLVAAHLVLVNLEGPFGEHAGVGLLASVAAALVVGALLAVTTRAVGRRSRRAALGVAAALAVATVVLFPTPIDAHESFQESPNDRSSCRGVTFRHYPPGTMDGSTDVYCVGLEAPLPAG